MKKGMVIVILFLVVVALLVWLLRERNDHPADTAKLRNDPTYSPHNYKQPNKAAAARQWEAAPSVLVPKSVPGNTSTANYKQPVSGRRPAGGITVKTVPPVADSERNYKAQHPGRQISLPADTVAGKPAKPTDHPAVDHD